MAFRDDVNRSQPVGPMIPAPDPTGPRYAIPDQFGRTPNYSDGMIVPQVQDQWGRSPSHPDYGMPPGGFGAGYVGGPYQPPDKFALPPPPATENELPPAVDTEPVARYDGSGIYGPWVPGYGSGVSPIPEGSAQSGPMAPAGTMPPEVGRPSPYAPSGPVTTAGGAPLQPGQSPFWGTVGTLPGMGTVGSLGALGGNMGRPAAGAVTGGMGRPAAGALGGSWLSRPSGVAGATLGALGGLFRRR